MDEAKRPHEGHAGTGFDWYRIGTWGAVAIMVFYLATEHLAHVVAVLPYLLLAACPLMHVFMHRGHGNHHGHKRDNQQDPNKGNQR